MIEKRKNNAYKKVNEEMILLYLDVGKFLYELKENSNYGDKITSKEHNGIITREYCMTDDINWMNKKAKWSGLKSILYY